MEKKIRIRCPNCSAVWIPIDMNNTLVGQVSTCSCGQRYRLLELSEDSRVEKVPSWSEELCFFCKERAACKDSLLRVLIHFEIPNPQGFPTPLIPVGQYYGSFQRYKSTLPTDFETSISGSVLVPRCSRCKNHQKWGHRIANGIIGACCIATMMIGFSSWGNEWRPAWEVLTVAFVFAVIGAIAGVAFLLVAGLFLLLLRKTGILPHTRKNILGKNDFKSFPPVAELVKKGWICVNTTD